MKVHSYLVLVRHGESEWNALHRWTGWTDIPLSKKGMQESKIAARLLSHIKFDYAYASDLSRTYKTLEIIKKEWKQAHLPTIRVPELKERHYGVFTGKNKWEIAKKVGEADFKKIRRGWDVSIPKGETLKDVYHRVVAYFDTYIRPLLRNGKNVLIVAHGNTNRALIKHLEHIPDELIADIEFQTGEIVIYQFDNEGKMILKEKKMSN